MDQLVPVEVHQRVELLRALAAVPLGLVRLVHDPVLVNVAHKLSTHGTHFPAEGVLARLVLQDRLRGVGVVLAVGARDLAGHVALEEVLHQGQAGFDAVVAQGARSLQGKGGAH